MDSSFYRAIRAFDLSDDVNPSTGESATSEPRSAAIRMLGGTRANTVSVDRADGRFVVRRRPGAFDSPQCVRFDHECLERLARAGLPVPRPLRCRDGGSCFIDGDEIFEAMSWVGGSRFVAGDRVSIASAGRVIGRFHQVVSDDLPEGKRGVLREDHPDLIEPYAEQLLSHAFDADERATLKRIRDQVFLVREHLDSGSYQSLPHVVIHGDFHPGNVAFTSSEVSALYDFDYMSLQARIRDVADGLMFFASHRDGTFNPDDIVSLTQCFEPELDLCREFLCAYQGTHSLTDAEWTMLPWMFRSRWLQMRLRGARKVPRTDQVGFVSRDFFSVVDWLDRHSVEFFDELRHSTTPG